MPHFLGNRSVYRFLFPASQSATFPKEIYDFSTLAPLLQSRSAAFPREISYFGTLILSSQRLESAIFPRQIYNFGTLALSSRRLKVLCFLGKSMILGLFPSLGLYSRSLKVLHFLGKSLILGNKTFVPQRAEREGPPKQNSRGVPRKSSS